MPFGLKNAGAMFQRAMDLMLRGRGSFAMCYIDDVLVHDRCTTEEEMLAHIEHVRQFLRRTHEKGMRVHAKKCRFGFLKVQFLGHELSAAGLAPQESKVDRSSRENA
jgi:hypothetical protein